MQEGRRFNVLSWFSLIICCSTGSRFYLFKTDRNKENEISRMREVFSAECHPGIKYGCGTMLILIAPMWITWEVCGSRCTTWWRMPKSMSNRLRRLCSFSLWPLVMSLSISMRQQVCACWVRKTKRRSTTRSTVPTSTRTSIFTCVVTCCRRSMARWRRCMAGSPWTSSYESPCDSE